jgi:thymidylate kinase
MSTVALIGPDGTGKTTVAEGLVAECPFPMKYLYMGMSIESSNVALPTSRLAHRIKVAQHRRALAKRGDPVPTDIHLHGVEHRTDQRGRLGAIARLLRRISEESYRQLVSWIYQWQGYVVLYDRHFLFDALPPPANLRAPRRLTDRIHNWFLYRCYPRPDLAILLDAPPEVLYARKQEVPMEYLRADREALLDKRGYAGEFVVVPTDQPFEQVLASVVDLVVERIGSKAAHG